jgi:hypothetical protein
MCIWKCCVFVEKHEQKGRSHNKFKGANEEFRSCSSARRNHFQRWQGPDQGGTTDHPRGLRRKVLTSCEKTPYLDRGDDDLKMTQIKGAKSKMPRWAAGRKTSPNRPRKGLGWPARSDRPKDFLWRFSPPFDLVAPRSFNSSLLRLPPHPIILPTPSTRKPPPQGRELESSSEGSTPAEGRKQEDSKPMA